MPDLKISLITVSYNAGNSIDRCIQSVLLQSYPNIEYIIIDGASADDTLTRINNYGDKVSIIVSEPDRGIYDAMNKGIAMATGEVVGMLNADDYFADNDVLSAVAEAFALSATEVVYGDLDYVSQAGRVVRKWRSGGYRPGIFNRGWMPPHPTFYARRNLFTKFGNYRLDFGTAADFELMLRFIHLNKVTLSYLPKVMVKMVTGGASNSGVKVRLKVLASDLRAMYLNKVRFPLVALPLKILSKLRQFL